MAARQKATDDQIKASYAETGSVWASAAALGMCGQSVHERLLKLGACKPLRIFGEDEKQVLREQYEAAANAGKLDELAKAMGRTKPFICRQAKEIGLTDQSRKRSYLAGIANAAMKAWHATHEHPKGMLGKKHSAEVCALISSLGAARWASLTDDQQADQILKRLQSRARRSGGKNVSNTEAPGASWRAGWRDIGGQRCYFRSRWEANYARYLQHLIEDGKLKSWEHEPHTFWFEGIRRGSMSYLPDFRVIDAEGNVTFHEVKGWMDERSRTKLARMAKYFPEVAVVVIAADEYKLMNRAMRFVIEGWER